MNIQTPAYRRKQKRASRFTPNQNIPLRFKEDDRRILQNIARYSFLDSRQIIAVSRQKRKKVLSRLSKLYHNGFVDRPIHENNIPVAYTLTRKGARVAEGDQITGKRLKTVRIKSREYLAHTLKITDFKICRELALDDLGANPDITLIDSESIRAIWLANKAAGVQFRPLGWKIKTRWQEGAKQTELDFNIIPDELFGFHHARHGASYFALEADRGTMPVKRTDFSKTSIYKKFIGYQAAAKQGILKAKLAFPNLRVLFTVPTQARMETMVRINKEMDPQHKGFRMFYFTQDSNIDLGDPSKILARIWTNGRGERVSLLD